MSFIKKEITDINFKDFLALLKEGGSVEIYTDGSCVGNPGPGGWGAVFISRDRRAILSGFEPHTTNNRMELKAAIEAIKALPSKVKITLYTDSSYVKNGITSWIKEWIAHNWISAAKKPVKNKDLWLELSAISYGRDIDWNWIRGHGACTNNNNADFVARSAIITSYMQDDET
jgi:ribonuclease HI